MHAVDHTREPEAKATTTERRWRNVFRDLPLEHGFEPMRVEGRLPADLVGTLYRCGPGSFQTQGVPNGHLFDGDGAIAAVRLDGAAATGATRFVDTVGRRKEEEAGRPLYAGFGRTGAGFRRFGAMVKNAANTNILPWNDQLLALFEAGLPTAMSSELETIGQTDLGGALKKVFSAHPHRVASRNATYNFGMRYGVRMMLDLYELSDAGEARRLTSIPVNGAPMMHDFIVTDRYAIIMVIPLKLRVFPALLGMGSIHDNFRWNPEEGNEVIVVPLDDPERITRFTTDPHFLWHYANAWDEGDEVVFDFTRYPDASSLGWLADRFEQGPTAETANVMARARLDPKAKTLDVQTLWDGACDFPRIHPRVEGAKYEWMYVAFHKHVCGAETGIHDRLAKIDTRTGDATELAFGSEQYPGEPVFVPKADGVAEDDGYLLSVVYDAQVDASHLAVIDASRFEDGPVARVWFAHHIPITFHGNWAPRG